MPRSATALLVVLLALVLPSQASAQASFGVGGGPVILSDKLKNGIEDLDVANNGYHLMLNMLLESDDLPWPIRGDFDYQKLGAPDGLQQYRHFAGFIAARLGPSAATAFIPYALLGVGMYVSDFRGDAKALAPGWGADVGLNAGAGASFAVGGMNPFVEVRYHRVVSYSPRAFIPITVGLNF
jgi:hypothetical protein